MSMQSLYDTGRGPSIHINKIYCYGLILFFHVLPSKIMKTFVPFTWQIDRIRIDTMHISVKYNFYRNNFHFSKALVKYKFSNTYNLVIGKEETTKFVDAKGPPQQPRKQSNHKTGRLH